MSLLASSVVPPRNKRTSQTVGFAHAESPSKRFKSQHGGDYASLKLPRNTASEHATFQERLLRSYYSASMAPIVLPMAHALQHDDTAEFRSVIDDLTIENQKLRKKLKKYDRLHCSHLKDDKLFEIRVHPSMPPQRRQQLEHILRSVASLDQNAPLPGMPKFCAEEKPKISSSSCSRLVDSAYASMSGTGSQMMQTRVSASSQPTAQDVQTYLHQIPKKAVPKAALAMSDKAKSKLVVRRLEQIFTGRGPNGMLYPQRRQQKGSSAASINADGIRAGTSLGSLWDEGTREAQMTTEAESDYTAMRLDNQSVLAEKNADHGKASASDGRTQRLEQRPTRPRDLDLQRAQLSAENLDYICHLGLGNTTTGMDLLIEPAEDKETDDGWIWLNLLSSMAQLHTLNVTQDFVRKAIIQRSERFKLSADGSKVKWLGGTTLTRQDSNSEESECSGKVGQEISEASPDGSVTLDSVTANEAATDRRINLLSATDRSRDVKPPRTVHSSLDKVRYEPMFAWHEPAPSDDDTFLTSTADDSSHSGLDRQTRRTVRMASNDSNTKRLRSRDNGPMIFYQSANFCTDLGGTFPAQDSRDRNFIHTYERFTTQPIGQSDPEYSLANTSTKFVAACASSSSRQTLSESITTNSNGHVRSALDLDDLRMSISCYADKQSESPSVPALSSSPILEFEASGLGGVQPRDNFVIGVKVGIYPQSSGKVTIPCRRRHRLLHNTAAPTPNQPKSRVTSRILSSVKIPLDPSSLPPASYIDLPFDRSQTGHHSDLDDNADITADLRRATTTHGLQAEYRGRRRDTRSTTPSSDETLSSSSSSSIDLLAHARMQDPTGVQRLQRAFERDNLSVGILSGDGDTDADDNNDNYDDHDGDTGSL